MDPDQEKEKEIQEILEQRKIQVESLLTSDTKSSTRPQAGAIRFQTMMSDSSQQEEIQYSKFKTNYCYLISLTINMGLSSSMFGFAVASGGQAFVALKHQFGWDLNDKELIDSKAKILSTLAIGGVALGCIVGGKLIQFGKRRVIIVLNFLEILASIMCIFLNWPLMLAGRTLFSIIAGLIVAVTPKILGETIPAHLIDYGFGASTNVMINVAIMSTMLLGMGYPSGDDESVTKELETTEYWKTFYLSPVPFLTIALLMNLFVHRQDSLVYHVQKGERDQALIIISKIYSKEDKDVHERIYNDMRFKELQNESKENVGITAALFHPDYRKATWICIFLGVFSQLTGTNVVNVYAESIFENIREQTHITGGLTPEQCSYCVGFSGFLGTVLSNLTIACLTRRGLFIGGHCCMGVFLVGVALFIKYQYPTLTIISMSLFIISFQSTNGTCFWNYTEEVVPEVALGFCLGCLMLTLTVLTFVSPYLMDGSFGASNTFFLFASFQLVTCTVLCICMRETKGMSMHEKLNVYKPKKKSMKQVIE